MLDNSFNSLDKVKVVELYPHKKHYLYFLHFVIQSGIERNKTLAKVADRFGYNFHGG